MIDNRKFSLIVIGSGGTGSYFLKEFSRFYQQRRDIFNSMCIFDGDIVEDKNLMRQSFLPEDVGFNKASVMASVLNDAFDLNWTAYARYVTKAEEIKAAFSPNTIPVIVGCVDNHACRLVCEEIFGTHESCVYIDSANEFSSGEVVVAIKDKGRILGPVRSSYFPEIKEGDLRAVTEISCEELNNSSPQHIATNMLAGNILLSCICNLISGGLKPGVVYFDAANYSSDFMERKVA